MAKALAKGSRITGAQRTTLASQYAKRYAAGESIRKIADDAGRSFGFVHGVLKEAGVELRGRGGATRGVKKTASSSAAKKTTGCQEDSCEEDYLPRRLRLQPRSRRPRRPRQRRRPPRRLRLQPRSRRPRRPPQRRPPPRRLRLQPRSPRPRKPPQRRPPQRRPLPGSADRNFPPGPGRDVAAGPLRCAYARGLRTFLAALSVGGPE